MARARVLHVSTFEWNWFANNVGNRHETVWTTEQETTLIHVVQCNSLVENRFSLRKSTVASGGRIRKFRRVSFSNQIVEKPVKYNMRVLSVSTGNNLSNIAVRTLKRRGKIFFVSLSKFSLPYYVVRTTFGEDASLHTYNLLYNEMERGRIYVVIFPIV